MNPQDFILDTDWATLKNDNLGFMSLTIPAGSTIASNSSTTWQFEKDIGTINASMRVQMVSNLLPNQWTPGNMRSIDLSLNYSGSISTEGAVVSIIRIAPSTLRIYCTHFNFSPVTATVATTQVVTANIATFLSPFN